MSLNRKAFEEWASQKGYPVVRDASRYRAHITEALWTAWRASAIHWAAWLTMRQPRNREILDTVLEDDS